MSDQKLEARLQRLEDLEAIRSVMMLYADIINKGWGGRVADADRMGEAFAADARWSSKDMGIEANGIEEITQGLVMSTKEIDFSQHVFLNPQIEIDGDSASADWLMWIVSRQLDGARMVYLSEAVTYVRTTDGWRIQTMDLEVAGFNGFPGPPNGPATGDGP